jgi:hypothetical protein
MQVEICASLRQQRGAAKGGAALAVALRMGEAAAAELAAIPDTPALERRDAALLDNAGTTRDGGKAEMRQLVEAFRSGRPFDLFTASPSELLACVVARTGPELAPELAWA